MSLKRIDIVKSLIELSCPLETIVASLHEFDWDYEEEPVELLRAHLISVLHRYANGALSASDVECWANLLEGRDDICFENGAEEWIGAVVYELANPTLTVPLDINRARQLIAEGQDQASQ